MVLLRSGDIAPCGSSTGTSVLYEERCQERERGSQESHVVKRGMRV